MPDNCSSFGLCTVPAAKITSPRARNTRSTLLTREVTPVARAPSNKTRYTKAPVIRRKLVRRSAGLRNAAEELMRRPFLILC